MKFASSRVRMNRTSCLNKANTPGTLGSEYDGDRSKAPVARKNARDEHDSCIALAATRSMAGCGRCARCSEMKVNVIRIADRRMLTYLDKTHARSVSIMLPDGGSGFLSVWCAIRAEGYSEVKMEVATPTLQWVEQMLRLLAGKKITGTVTIRFSQGGVQSLAVNQELRPWHQGPVIAPQQDA